MKKNILLYLMPLLFLTSAAELQGNCCRDFYAKLLGGANFLQDTSTNGNNSTYQAGYIVAGSLGYYLCDYGLRVEAEYAFRRNAISNIDFITQGSSRHGDFQTSSYMANLYWDLPCYCWRNIQPFIGTGIGYDHEHLHASNSRVIFDQKWDQFAWQAMAGLAYPISCNAEITLEYKFHQGGGHFYNHAIGIGLVYSFGLAR